MLEGLLLEEGWLGEAESDFVGGELVVAVGDGGNLALHGFLIEWVEVHLLVLLSVDVDSDSSSGDRRWEALK